ncbi:hypothetical protein MMC32_006846 [Xylographa parallela]|nr:hypothetical protein [Xylographa parallela]
MMFDQKKSDHSFAQSESYEKLLGEQTLSQAPEQSHNRHRIIYLLFGLFFAVNALWTLLLISKSFEQSDCHGGGPDLIYSPARDIISYEVVTTHSEIDSMNAFKGLPRPELDQAWNEAYLYCDGLPLSFCGGYLADMLEGPNIVVSSEDLKDINRTSIELADGSGYLGTLSVFHQIHCLDYIRKYIFREDYPSLEAPERRWQHVDHCFDEIRLSLMCHGDIALTTWSWNATEATPYANFNVKHECRNWDSILAWTKAHQANHSAIIRPEKSQP